MVLDDVDAQPAKAIAAAAAETIKALEMRIRALARRLLTPQGYTGRNTIGTNQLSRFLKDGRAGVDWNLRRASVPAALPRWCRETDRILPAAPDSVATCLVEEPP